MVWKLTHRFLMAHGACRGQRALFLKVFPEKGGAAITPGNLEMARAAGLNIEEMLYYYDRDPATNEYEKLAASTNARLYGNESEFARLCVAWGEDINNHEKQDAYNAEYARAVDEHRKIMEPAICAEVLRWAGTLADDWFPEQRIQDRETFEYRLATPEEIEVRVKAEDEEENKIRRALAERQTFRYAVADPHGALDAGLPLREEAAS